MRSTIRERSMKRSGRSRLLSNGSNKWPPHREIRRRSTCAAVPARAFALALGGGEPKPSVGGVANALERALHFGVLAFDDVAVGVPGHLHRRAEDDRNPRKRLRDLEQIP